MPTNDALNGLQLRSLIKKSGELELSLASVAVTAPADNEVIVKVQVTSLNPSDLGLLFAAAWWLFEASFLGQRHKEALS